MPFLPLHQKVSPWPQKTGRRRSRILSTTCEANVGTYIERASGTDRRCGVGSVMRQRLFRKAYKESQTTRS